MTDIKKAGNADESERNIELVINDPPVQVDCNKNASINQTKDAYMILMLENNAADSDANVISVFGAKTIETQIEAGLSVPQLVIENFAANKLTVTNISTNEKTAVKVGIYGRGKSTTHLDVGKKVNIGQFQSAGCTTVANPMNLQLTAKSEEARIFIFAIGEPTAVLLNSEDTDIPEGWTYTKDNSWQTTKNWKGNPLFILNVSNGIKTVEVLLQDLGM